jgi:hypothetical protein
VVKKYDKDRVKAVYIPKKVKVDLMVVAHANGQSANHLAGRLLRAALDSPELLRLQRERVESTQYDGVAPL